MQVVTHSMEDTRSFASTILGIIKQFVISQRDMLVDSFATVLTLSGPLGSGKTALTKKIAASLGVVEDVTSPTFVLRSDYTTSDSIFSTLIHIDAYRLHTSEPDTIGWGEIITNPKALIVVEWPEHLPGQLPPHHFSVKASVEHSVHTFAFSTISTV